MRHSAFGYILRQFSDVSARLNPHTSTPTVISSADCLHCTASHPCFLYPASFLGSAEHFSHFGLFQDSSRKKSLDGPFTGPLAPDLCLNKVQDLEHVEVHLSVRNSPTL